MGSLIVPTTQMKNLGLRGLSHFAQAVKLEAWRDSSVAEVFTTLSKGPQDFGSPAFQSKPGKSGGPSLAVNPGLESQRQGSLPTPKNLELDLPNPGLVRVLL